MATARRMSVLPVCLAEGAQFTRPAVHGFAQALSAELRRVRAVRRRHHSSRAPRAAQTASATRNPDATFCKTGERGVSSQMVSRWLNRSSSWPRRPGPRSRTPRPGRTRPHRPPGRAHRRRRPPAEHPPKLRPGLGSWTKFCADSGVPVLAVTPGTLVMFVKWLWTQPGGKKGTCTAPPTNRPPHLRHRGDRPRRARRAAGGRRRPARPQPAQTAGQRGGGQRGDPLAGDQRRVVQQFGEPLTHPVHGT